MFRGLKARHPDVHIKALTAVEIAHLARIEKVSVSEVLTALKDAGVTSLPGGGAEVFSPAARATIADKKLTCSRCARSRTRRAASSPTSRSPTTPTITSWARRSAGPEPRRRGSTI